MEALVSLLYVSSAVEYLSDEQLSELLDQSRQRNSELGITGLLLYSDGSFMQLIEGPASHIDAVFDSISRDPRHASIMLVDRGITASREFGDWSMAFRKIDLPAWIRFHRAMGLGTDSSVQKTHDSELGSKRRLLRYMWNCSDFRQI